MKMNITKTKLLALVSLLVLSACVSDDLANEGDLQDFTGPTPFYNFSNVAFGEFDCNENEISTNYQYLFQAGSNLAVNGTQYQWNVTDANGNPVDVVLINKDLPILQLQIDAQRSGL